MKFLITAFLLVFALSFSGCDKAQESSLSPSIQALKTNQTLVMIYSACHWGCTKGTVTFSENKAYWNDRSLTLTQQEIGSLDQYFKNGRSPEEGWKCSLPIEINFELRKGQKAVNSKELQIYPCHFGGVYVVTPEDLMYHFTKSPNEIPSWRLSAEKQNESLIIEE